MQFQSELRHDFLVNMDSCLVFAAFLKTLENYVVGGSTPQPRHPANGGGSIPYQTTLHCEELQALTNISVIV